MATIIGGNGTGILDSSLYLLNRNDTTGAGTPGDGEQVYINISDGNLMIGHQDEFLPSETNNFLTLRTYNSQGGFNNALGDGWMLSELATLEHIDANRIVLLNGDGSEFTFTFDPDSGVFRGRTRNYQSADGAGAYETIRFDQSSHTYTLTQSDQTQLTFDITGKLLQSVDTNGNTLTYHYDPSPKLASITDNSGHQLSFLYQNGNLTQIRDETGTVFAQYGYWQDRLVSITDRAGQTTTYDYYSNGMLQSLTLPSTQGEPTRTLYFTYSLRDDGRLTLSSFTDAQGNVTRFSYNFIKDVHGDDAGGTTTVTNAAGNTTTYTYNADGQITKVRDANGLDTAYTYDSNENLTSVTDANGSAIVKSDSTYYRNLRQSYGIVDFTGQGKLVSQLTSSDIAALKAHYTTTYTYDDNGNQVSRQDGSGNLTTNTYTSFNKLATTTSANGNALVTSDDPQYIAKRQELGFINPSTGQGKTVAQLTAADRQAILSLYTTTYSYDADQNVTQVQAGGGDLTKFAYDTFGNLTRRTVYLDKTNLTDPGKQEVTQYFYDSFGNNFKTIDAQGVTTLATYDHFGNRTSQTDGNGGITRFVYDAENRLISRTDPLGNTTLNFYDAVGNLTAATDAGGHTVFYFYNADNLLVSTLNPSDDPGFAFTRNRVTSYAYDVMGNRTSSTDAQGNTTTYNYDALNRLVTTTTPTVKNASGAFVRYTTSLGYDGIGNSISVINSNGNRTDTVYNPSNLVSRVTDPTGHITQYAYDADLNQVSIVVGAELAPAARQILKFDYDQKDRLIGATDALGGQQRYAYDGANNRISQTDANGNTTTYTFDRDNRLLVITRPAVTDPVTGSSVRYTVQYQYDANGNRVAVTDENGHTITTAYDKDNRAVLVTDANGIQTVYSYDSRDNRTSVQIGVTAHISRTGAVVIDSVENSQVTTYAYDEFNQVIAKTDGVGNALITSDSALYIALRKQLGIVDGNGNGKRVAQLTFFDLSILKAQFTEHYTYDRVGNYTSTTDHLGRTTSFTYDNLNRLVKTTDASGQSTTTAYDGNGNRVSTTDALGRTTRYVYDAINRLADTTDALGVDTHQVYDSFGNVTSRTAAFGTTDARTSTFVYDLDNRLVTSTDPVGNTQSYVYDAVGNRLRLTDAKGQATNYVYDALNRNIAVIDPLGFQIRTTYDGVGNRLSLVDGRGGITRFTYDAGNREIQVQDAEGRLTTFTYDIRGNQVTQTTAAGTPEAETTTFSYDAENHLRQTTDASGKVSTRDFDAVYNLTRTTDANGNPTTYAYDALNRQITITNALGGVTTFAFDAANNLLKVTDPNGHTITYAYDARNQRIKATDALGVSTTYAYDSVGNQIRITRAANTSAAATTTFTYSLDNKLLSQTDALGHTQTNQYDADNNLVTVTDALGHATHYAYDADNRVSSITDPLGNVTQYKYDANGNRVQITDARGFTSTRYYNADNEVVLSVDNDGYATSTSYDHNGNVTSQTLYATRLALPLDPTVLPTPRSSASDRTSTFTYDPLNRLASKTDGEGYITKFVYDAVGNSTQTLRALDKAGTQFEITRLYYDAANRQVAQLSAQGYLTTYQYDAAGNRVGQIQYDQVVSAPASGTPRPVAGDAGRQTRFAYDADNQLVSQTDARGAITGYTYDARGNRTSTTEAVGTSAARTTTYVYDAANRYIETTNAIGIVTHMDLDANGNVLRRHDAFGTAQERVSTFTYDANNRAVSATDALGVVTQTAYDAAGNVVTRTIGAGTSAPQASTFTYDGDSRQITAVDASGTTTTYAYDAAGDQISLTQATGLPEARSNTFTYDRANRLVSATDALGTVTQYQYDGVGNKLVTIQAAGGTQQRQTTYQYDLDNRLTRITDPMGAVTSYQYDAQGNQTRIVDANGGAQVNTFDALGHALSSLSAAGVLIRNAYDLRGNLVSTTQSFANGSDARTSTYAYDLLNRETVVTDGEGFSTSITYDAFGNQTRITHGQYLVATTDPNYSAAKAAVAFPQTNTLAYDADNRLLSLTDGVGNVTSYQYDVFGNRTSTTDGNGHTTRYSYDVLNRLVQTVTPEGGITRFTYDHIGNRIAQDQLQSGSATSGVVAHTAYQYDANGHLTSQTDPLGVVTQYTYDAMGNQISKTVAAGTSDARTTRVEYDLDNRKTADVDALANRTTYAYDASGNRIKVTDALGHVAHYYYDGANQLQEIVDPQGIINTFSYDAAGNRIQTRVFTTPVNGAVDDHVSPTPTPDSQDRITTQQFDRANRLIAETAPDNSLAQYTYDGAGNRLTDTQFANTSAPRTSRFTYDADNRVTSFTDVDGSVTTFTYDAANNRLSQTITSTTDPNPVRTTTYAYDANNREVTNTFDPSGLDIVQSTVYDHLGNVVSKTDGNGHTSTFAYDLNNREIGQTDALGNTSTSTYDRAGNKISTTDARGNTTNYVYDANNRLLQEIRPSVEIYTTGGGLTTGRPTTTHVYDAIGNEVQTIDAAGNVTTSYFDGNGRLSARINGDNALTTYTYDSYGNELSQTLYMTRVGSQDPATIPTPPAGASQQITYAYDKMGRLTQTTYPATQITTLSNTNTSAPGSTTTTTQVTERNVYDAYGNVIASYDRNGNQTLNFYDVKDRRTASVDALGFLTQWTYDQQGNVLQQKQYAQALDPSTLSPGVLPTPPAGDVAEIDIQYDAASRRTKLISPTISTFDPTTQTTTVMRPTTTFTYDKVGNQLTKTLGAGTAQAVTEYSYYDADNRQIAVINSGRVLATYTYDANGNVVAQKRYINAVGASVDLTQLSGTSNFASLVTAAATQDEESDFTFDALNRGTSQSDVLSSGTLTRQTKFDAVSNRTYTRDEDGFLTQVSYDGVGRIAESISADGSGTRYQYDAAGNNILTYTGIVTGGPPAAATGIAATLGAQVSLSWNTGSAQQPGQSPVQTWVVYDTTSHQSPSDYANRTPTQVSTTGHAQASLASAASGSTIFFRVVTQDGAGNQTWTAEESLTIPPRFTAFSVAQPSADTLVVTASFDPGVNNPQLLYGANGSLGQSAAFVLQADGTYQATLTGLTNPAALSFAVHWSDGSGNHYSSSTGTFAAVEDQVGTTTTVNQNQIVNGANTSFTLAIGTKVPTSYATGLTSVQAQWHLAGSGNVFATAVSGTDSGQGFTTYSAVLGSTSNLTAGTYEIVITGLRSDGTSVELDRFNYTTGPSATSLTRSAVSWAQPAVGDDQLVIIDGQNAPSQRDSGRVVATDVSTAASAGYSVFYGQDFADTHTVNVSSVANATSGFDVTVQASLSANEAANVGSGGLHLAWRPADTGTTFANDVAVPSSGTNSYSTTLSGLAAGQYDIEVYYVDTSGRKVVVEWQRIDTATANGSFGGHSLTVLAQESGGSINTSALGVISVTPGLYTGSLDVAALTSSLSLSLTDTGNAGGFLQTDGRSTGYFTESQYDALNYKTASNAGDGLWRQFGVDGNGNVVQTDLLGDRSHPSYNPAAPITTYTAYDARNRKVADFGAPVAAPGSSTLTRPVTRSSYNFQDKITSQTDPLGNTTQYSYNLLGTLTQRTDALGGTLQTLVDQFGNVTAEITELGHRSLKFYDLQGRLTSEQDALGNTTTYTYDTFDRQLTQTDALGNRIGYGYDQRDRLISQTDPLGNNATFAYDGRDNRISTVYPLGERTDQVYDGLGRVIDTQVFLSGQPAHTQIAYDAYGNVISETDAMGRTKTHVYGAFGRLLEDIDEDGIVVAYAYDVYGRRTNEYDPTGVSNPAAATDPSGAKDIQKTYDQAGRVTAITDLGTGVSTAYTYDLSGRRLAEGITTPGNAHNRGITYQYDALGQMVRWADSVTGDNLNRLFDLEGNLVRAYTDAGYDPLGQNTSANPNFRYIDHVYSYDADRHVLKEVQRTTSPAGQTDDSDIINAYTYDAASNRLTWNNGKTTVSYTYDADGRSLEGDYTSDTGDQVRQVWSYDAMGNVLSFTILTNGSQTSSTVSTYNDANRVLTNSKDGQVTTNTYDASMRLTQVVLQNNGQTFTYDYSYFGDGREKSIKAFGDANGNSTSTYDVNKIRSSVNLGQGDNQDRPEIKTFLADNEGHIIFERHDDGKSSQAETRELLYANGAPLGENDVGTDGKLNILLDSDSYAPVQNLSDTNPGNNLTYVIRNGDTLQSIALQMYGNASLWFVIAEANGLSAGEALKAGTQILIPNTIKSGTITADNHKVYSESDIVGSTLPNLKSPPPPSHGGGCGSILAIIIVVVIAVVVAVVTAGIGGALVAALGISTLTTGGLIAAAAVYAVTGAVIAAIGSVVQQGLFIALGYQEKFSWKQVAGAAVAGAFSGAASGLAVGAQLAATAGELSDTAAEYVRVSSALLKVAGAASEQEIDNGRITSWTSLAAAGVGGYADAARAINAGATAVNSLSSEAFKQSASSALGTASTVSTVANYVTPWVQLAETSVRNGRLTPTDWATAVGATLSQAVNDQLAVKPGAGQDLTLGERLYNSTLQLGSKALVAGALSTVDKNAAQSYLQNAVGQEAGQFIGQTLAQPIQGYFADLTQRIQANRAARAAAADADAQTAANSGQQNTQTQTITTDHADGVIKDQDGNVVEPDSTIPTDQATDTQPTPTTFTVGPEGARGFWGIAKSMLGPDASNAEIQALVLQIMTANPGVTVFHQGDELNLPNGDISPEAKHTYLAMDTAYQAELARRRAAAAAAAAAAQQPTTTEQGTFSGDLELARQTGLSMDQILSLRANGIDPTTIGSGTILLTSLQAQQTGLSPFDPQGADSSLNPVWTASTGGTTPTTGGTATTTGGSPGGHYETMPTYDPASGVPNGGTEEVWVPDQEMPYGEQMAHVGQVGIGALKGVVNGIPKLVVGLGTLLWEGAQMQGLTEAGVDPEESYKIATNSTSGWWDGTVLPYVNTEQKLGGFGGEFASPFVYGKAIQAAGAVPRLFTLTEEISNASKLTNAPELITAPELTLAPEVTVAPELTTAPELSPASLPEAANAGTNPAAVVTDTRTAGQRVYGPYYEQAQQLHADNPAFFPDPDAPGTSIVKGADLSQARAEYQAMVQSGELPAGHHIQGLTFGGENEAANITFTGESTIKASQLEGLDLSFYNQQGYGKAGAQVLKIYQETPGGIFQFGLNPAHTQATTFQNQVLAWQRLMGLR